MGFLCVLYNLATVIVVASVTAFVPLRVMTAITANRQAAIIQIIMESLSFLLASGVVLAITVNTDSIKFIVRVITMVGAIFAKI